MLQNALCYRVLQARRSKTGDLKFYKKTPFLKEGAFYYGVKCLKKFYRLVFA